MNILHSARRWAVGVTLVLATAAHGQTKADLYDFLPNSRTVTEGRSLAFFAEGAQGVVQWQVSQRGSTAWVNVVDDNLYHGSTTKTLEISAVTADMNFQVYRYTNTANGITHVSDPIPVYVAPLVFPTPSGLAFDGAGGLLVSDASTHTIQQVANASLAGWGNLVKCPVTPIVGQKGEAGAADGDGAGARFNQPGGLTGMGADGFLVADTANGTIRRVKGTMVTTVAGSSTGRGSVDGSGVVARFSSPMAIARGPDGACYVADATNHTIRKVASDGTVSTFAGSAGMAGAVDGTGTAARFNNPTGIAVSADGTVFVSDTTNNLIRRITPAGVVTTVAGIAGVAGTKDGTGDEAMFNGPTGLTLRGVVTTPGTNHLFVADTGNCTIRSIWVRDEKVEVTTYAGVAGVGGLQDGTGYAYFNALFNQPRAIVADETGLLFIADTGNAAIRVISQYDGVCFTLPLEIAFGSGPTPVPPPPPATPPPVPPTTTPANGNSSAGGGGAPSEWFVAALAGAWLLRRLTAGRKPRSR